MTVHTGRMQPCSSAVTEVGALDPNSGPLPSLNVPYPLSMFPRHAEVQDLSFNRLYCLGLRLSPRRGRTPNWLIRLSVT